jgi:rhombotail lipoprotein
MMRRERLRGVAYVLLLVVSSSCGGMAMKSARLGAAAMPLPPPVPLERSVFARDPQGQLSEDALQQILASRLELDLPARVGVLPVIAATDWRGPNPDYMTVPAGVAAFVKRLRGAEGFTLVTEVMPIPSGALGMEALREIAARYRLRYVILYRENVRKRTHLNAIAWGYATIIGTLFLPGQEQIVNGYMEASLFDVKTGLLLFTTRRSVRASTSTNVWYQADKIEELQSKLVTRFAPDLADDVKIDLYRFADAAKIENDRRDRAAGLLPSTPSVPSASPPSAAGAAGPTGLAAP